MLRIAPRTAARRCAFCHDDLLGVSHTCPDCATATHLECWSGGCLTPGCQPRIRIAPIGGSSSARQTWVVFAAMFALFFLSAASGIFSLATNPPVLSQRDLDAARVTELGPTLKMWTARQVWGDYPYYAGSKLIGELESMGLPGLKYVYPSELGVAFYFRESDTHTHGIFVAHPNAEIDCANPPRGVRLIRPTRVPGVFQIWTY